MNTDIKIYPWESTPALRWNNGTLEQLFAQVTITTTQSWLKTTITRSSISAWRKVAETESGTEIAS